MTIGIIGAGRSVSSLAVAALCRTYGCEVKIVELPRDSNKIRGNSGSCFFIDEVSSFNAAEAGERLRKAMTAMSHTPYIEEKPKEPKKPIFFQRDIVPRKKRRFGK